MKKIIFFCVIFMQIFVLYAQDNREILKQRNFKGTALYGYMNGGSDLYYEYGFKELKVTELNFTFNYNNVPVTEKYTVEVYKTQTPHGAFGLYSVHVHKFLQRDMYGFFDCITKYQLQGCVYDEYISIVFENPTEQGREGAIKLYKDYLLNLSQPQKLKIPDLVIEYLGEALSGRLRLIQGQIALNNSAQDLYPLFEGFSNFDLWLVDDENESGKLVYKAIINLPSIEERDKFLKINNNRKISDDFAPVVVKDISQTAIYLILAE